MLAEGESNQWLIHFKTIGNENEHDGPWNIKLERRSGNSGLFESLHQKQTDLQGHTFTRCTEVVTAPSLAETTYFLQRKFIWILQSQKRVDTKVHVKVRVISQNIPEH